MVEVDGYWGEGFWGEGYWGEGYWGEYGVVVPPPGLKWICCPACGEITDLQRIGQVGNIRPFTENIRPEEQETGSLNKWLGRPETNEGPKYRPMQRSRKHRVAHSDKIKCGFCGTVFYSEEATIFEAMGRDTVDDTSF